MSARIASSPSAFSPSLIMRQLLSNGLCGLGSFFIALVVLTGCSPEKPNEISASKSGFAPSDADNTASSSQTNSSASAKNPTSETSTASNSNNTAGQSPAISSQVQSSQGQTASGNASLGNQANSSVPNPGIDIPKPAQNDFKSWVLYLANVDKAFQQLAISFSQQRISEDQMRKQGMQVANLKLEGSESLAKIANTPDEKDAATLGKIQALSLLAQLGDKNAMSSLKLFMQDSKVIESPKVAHQAGLVMLSLLMTEFNAGTLKSAAPIIEKTKELFAKKELLTSADLGVAQQAMALIGQQGDEDSLKELVKMTIEAFDTHKDPRIRMQVWNMKVGDSKELAAFGESLQANTESPNAENLAKLTESTDTFVKAFPDSLTIKSIVDMVVQLEYSGNVDAAKMLADRGLAGIELIDIPELRANVEKIIKGFNQRSAIVGQPLDMSGLADLEGKKFDFETYRGKVVLVDFWATWCGPCLQELPNLEKVYQDFQDKGFEIVGVNLDEELEDVKAFGEKKKLPWTTVRSSDPEKTAFETPAADRIGISAIPFIALIDRQGNVAAIHVRGDRVAEKVAELLAKQ